MSYAGNAFQNTVLKETKKGKKNEAGNISSHWVTLRKTEGTGN
jgi:hypothetical protein